MDQSGSDSSMADSNRSSGCLHLLDGGSSDSSMADSNWSNPGDLVFDPFCSDSSMADSNGASWLHCWGDGTVQIPLWPIVTPTWLNSPLRSNRVQIPLWPIVTCRCRFDAAGQPGSDSSMADSNGAWHGWARRGKAVQIPLWPIVTP